MLKGKAVILRAIEKNDLERTRKWVNDYDIAKKMLRVLPVSMVEQQNWYKDIKSSQKKIVFAISIIEDGSHIGNCGLYNIDAINRKAEAWILIGEKRYRAKGIGKEAMKLLVSYAFKNLNLNKVYLHVGNFNKTATRLYDNLGFTIEGRLKQEVYISGRYCDVYRMAILKKDQRRF